MDSSEQIILIEHNPEDQYFENQPNDPLNSSLIKSLCQISELVYKPQIFFTENYTKNSYKTYERFQQIPEDQSDESILCGFTEKEYECFSYIQSEPQLFESIIDCQCYVCIFNKDSILIAFRGSSDFKDWIANANIIKAKMELPDVPDNELPKVHLGFLRQFTSVENKITDYINEILQNDINNTIKNIVYTGHSLGGGLASIALINYSHKYTQLKHMCVTFGAPRVGNKSFKKKFQEKCNFSKRYVNYYDPVPSLPSSLHYCNTCPSEYINQNIIEEVDTPMSRFFWILYYQIGNLFCSKYNPINDHNINNYYDKLCDLLPDDDKKNQ